MSDQHPNELDDTNETLIVLAQIGAAVPVLSARLEVRWHQPETVKSHMVVITDIKELRMRCGLAEMAHTPFTVEQVNQLRREIDLPPLTDSEIAKLPGQPGLAG